MMLQRIVFASVLFLLVFSSGVFAIRSPENGDSESGVLVDDSDLFIDYEGYIDERVDELSQASEKSYPLTTSSQKRQALEISYFGSFVSPFTQAETKIIYDPLEERPLRVVFEKSRSLAPGFFSKATNFITSRAPPPIGKEVIAFLDRYKNELKIDTTQLVGEKVVRVGSLEAVSFEQVYRGVPVFNGYVKTVTSRRQLSLLDSNFHPKIQIDVVPKVTKEQAALFAQQWIGTNVDPLDELLFIYPRISEDGANYYLAYKVDFPVINGRSGKLRAPVVFIDAHDGRFIDAFDDIRYVSASGHVSGMTYPDPFVGMRVRKDFSDEYVQSDSSSATTDKTGRFSFDAGQRISTMFEGPYTKVVDNSINDGFDLRVYETGAGDGIEIDWEQHDLSYKQEASNVFYHANFLHEFYTEREAPFNLRDAMNFQMIANLGLLGECNAFADGASINFFRPGACEPLSLLSDVVIHEYTHNIIDQVAPRLSRIYWGETGNMNEAYADYFACSITEDPCLSSIRPGQACLRTCDNTNVYPGDYDDEPHTGAEIISGSIWDFREIVGKDIADKLALLAISQDPQSFSELLDNFVILDDATYGNNDLSDGTPHVREICNSFYTNHRIFSPSCYDYLPLVGVVTLPSEIRGSIDILGVVGGEQFDHYSLEYQKDGEQEWTIFYTSSNGVRTGVVYSGFDSTLLDEGIYSFKLVVTGKDGGEVQLILKSTINNLDLLIFTGDVYGMKSPLEIRGSLIGEFDSFEVVYLIDGVEFSDGIVLTNSGRGEIENDVIAVFDPSVLKRSITTDIRVRLFYSDGRRVEDSVSVSFDSSLKQGWPQRFPFSSYFAPFIEPVVDDVNRDGKKEIFVDIGGDLDNPPRVYAFNEDGSYLEGWPVDATPYNGYAHIGGITVENIDSDNSNKEIIVSVNDNLVVYRADGSILRNILMPENNANYITSSGAFITDLDNDGRKEIIKQYHRYRDSDSSFIDNEPVVIVMDEFGNPLPGWPQPTGDYGLPPLKDLVRTSPVVADLDNDGVKEIIVNQGLPPLGSLNHLYAFHIDGSSLENFPIDIRGDMHFSPVIADIDKDGYRDIIISVWDNDYFDPNDFEDGLYAFNRRGEVLQGWPPLPGPLVQNPIVSDLNEDGNLEIIVPSSLERNIYVYDSFGGKLHDQRGAGRGTLIAGDVDNDGSSDIIFRSESKVSAFRSEENNGRISFSLIFSKPIEPSYRYDPYTAPALADLSNDGSTELIVGSRGSSPLRIKERRANLYVWELGTPYNSDWPMYMHDPQHTGCYDCDQLPNVVFSPADFDRDHDVDLDDYAVFEGCFVSNTVAEYKIKESESVIPDFLDDKEIFLKRVESNGNVLVLVLDRAINTLSPAILSRGETKIISGIAITNLDSFYSDSFEERWALLGIRKALDFSCRRSDSDIDGDIDLIDYGVFRSHLTSGNLPVLECVNDNDCASQPPEVKCELDPIVSRIAGMCRIPENACGCVEGRRRAINVEQKFCVSPLECIDGCCKKISDRVVSSQGGSASVIFGGGGSTVGRRRNIVGAVIDWMFRR